MKKLMIAAAVAAMTAGAFADDDPCTQPCPFGYQIKVALKTTSTLSVSNQTTACDTFCFRGPASLRLAGFVFGNTNVDDSDPCGGKGCQCNAWDGAKIVMWNYDTGADANFATMTGLQLDRIFSRNLDTSMVEIAFDLDALRFAGFGYAAKRDGKWTIKNLAGFCAGQLNQTCSACAATDPCTGACLGFDSAVVKVWGICDSETAAPQIDSATTAAYGKWTLDWSATVYNKVLDKTLSTEAISVTPGKDFKPATPIDFTFAAN